MKRVLTLLLALALALGALAAFSACDKTPDLEPTEPVVVIEDETTEAPPVETDPSIEEEEETTKPDEEETTAEEAVTVPQGTAAIVAFYNEAANNTKSHKKFTAQKYEKLDCNITEGFLTIVNGALNDLRKEETKKETFVNGKGTINTNETTKKFLPPGPGEFSYMSALQPGWVKSASCTQNADGTFTVKLTLKEETFLAKSENPTHHISCMDVLDVDWNGLPFKVHDETKGRNYDATINATVTKDGTLLQELHIYEPVEVKGQVQVLIWANITVAGYWKQDIQFTY